MNDREACEAALAALKQVGDDYPGSSCQQWCNEKIAEIRAALALASERAKQTASAQLELF